MFRLFRRQHLEKFLASFEKLGLTDLPHAVACARYHVLSNSIGGVPVEYMEESPRKAWVRFRYPRWMYAGPAICGVPVGVSRGFLRGWYAHNGVSLGNPRLGFVCVSEDMTGEFGLCGYFYEYERALADEERLQFARDEIPPDFVAQHQPTPPAEQWNALRLSRAARNYAVGYIRNGLAELDGVLGGDEASTLSGRAARLIGLQYYHATAQRIGAVDGDASDGANYLALMFRGMGDAAEVLPSAGAETARVLLHSNRLTHRLTRGLPEREQAVLLDCWKELWTGTVRSHRQQLMLNVAEDDGKLLWTVTTRR
jgi:hypothetical protein